jgi:hypothetical protein
MGAGQFSIFGAIEEKTGHGFTRIGTDEAMLESRAVVPLDGAVFEHQVRGEKNLVEWAAVMSTGRAQEMQKGSGQWLVISDQLLVLSSQFSVLSSQFSVLSSQFSVREEGA